MSKITFSAELFEQLGGVNWVRRSEGFEFCHFADQSLVEERPEKSLINEHVEPKEHQVTVSEETSEMDNIVVLGVGLDTIWQNDVHQAWLLWQNIMQAFDWDESQAVFFDTAHLASEEMMFSTMEEVIELGVDWVLTMDETHPISELLQEGVQVINVPDIESMLSDPYAKQTFYQSVVSVTAKH